MARYHADRVGLLVAEQMNAGIDENGFFDKFRSEWLAEHDGRCEKAEAGDHDRVLALVDRGVEDLKRGR